MAAIEANDQPEFGGQQVQELSLFLSLTVLLHKGMSRTLLNY